MTSANALKWLGRLIWTLIYGGLLLGLTGWAQGQPAGWMLMTAGGVLVVVGIALVGLRARIPDPQDASQFPSKDAT